jgi:hypothetical protein
MALYIYEFLYRGRPEGSDQPPAWHLQLGSDVKDELGREPRPGPAMGMAQADKNGWKLPEIIAAINADALAVADGLRADNDAKDQELRQERDARISAEAEVEALRTKAASDDTIAAAGGQELVGTQERMSP